MGNYRFKLSDMLPNAWFYKLNYMSPSKTSKSQNSMHKSSNKIVQSKTNSSSSTAAAPSQPFHRRKSYHFNRDFNVQPTLCNNPASHLSEPRAKSSNKRRSTKKTRASSRLIVNSSASSEYFSYRVSHEPICTKPGYTSEMYPNYSPDSSSCDAAVISDLDSDFGRVKLDSPSNFCHCRIQNNNTSISINNQKFEKLGRFDSVSQFELKPVITKLNKSDREIKPAVKFRGSSVKTEEESSCIVKNYSIDEEKKGPVRKVTVNSAGRKLRANSPRKGPKRVIQVQSRKSVSSGKVHEPKSVSSRLKSVAIVKESKEPDRDFKESMVEMIMEHNMRTKEDFEQLLACYLSLNSANYHHLIIKVFEQIWFEITGN